MNKNMWDNPVTQRNVKTLRELSYRFIEPEEGELACGDIGKGRLAEPDKIMKHVKSLLSC
jgi:phosphopantothenoylcysteine decarboxylase/phosphopantothenate--cysteine ligase